MNAKAEETGSKLDTVKLSMALLVLVSAVAAFYYYADQSLLLRVVGIVAAVAVALVISAQTEVGRKSLGFARDSRTEVRKVVWPTRQETIRTTIMVFVMVIIVSIFLWLLDMFLAWGVKLLTGQGG